MSKDTGRGGFADAQQALDQYWTLLDKLAVGLRQKDVFRWVGDIFRTMVTTHLRLLKVGVLRTSADRRNGPLC
jgi:hypothetical protein